MSREAKTAWQRERRALMAILAGREPHVTGRPVTGRSRTTKRRGDVEGQRARARLRLAQRRGDNGTTSTDHPLLALARSIVARLARPDRRATLHRPTYEDAVGEATVALVAGEDGEVAARSYVRAERQWEHHAVPMLVDPKWVDPEYVLCDHGYLRIGWCWDCAAEARS